MEENFIGSKFINSMGCIYIVTRFISKDVKASYWEVVFPYTGYSGIFTKNQIIRGYIKDRLFPHVAGVGYLGYAKTNRNNRYYNVWHNMLHRCYNPNFPEYKRYGALGVRVCTRWHCYQYFLEDVVKIDGYDEKLFLEGKIQLDKDLKQLDLDISQKVYSLYTCTFLSPLENNNLINNHYSFRAVSPDGIRYYDNNISNFCRKHNLDQKLVYQTITNRQKTTQNGWKFSK